MSSTRICSSKRKVWHCELKRSVDISTVEKIESQFCNFIFAKSSPPLTLRKREIELATVSLKDSQFCGKKLLRKNSYLVAVSIFQLFIGISVFRHLSFPSLSHWSDTGFLWLVKNNVSLLTRLLNENIRSRNF